jgi:hypothetical protein
MKLLADQERVRLAKEHQEKKAMNGYTKDKGDDFKPIDLLKDKNFRRTVQGCFKSTSRNDW